MNESLKEHLHLQLGNNGTLGVSRLKSHIFVHGALNGFHSSSLVYKYMYYGSQMKVPLHRHSFRMNTPGNPSHYQD